MRALFSSVKSARAASPRPWRQLSTSAPSSRSSATSSDPSAGSASATSRLRSDPRASGCGSTGRPSSESRRADTPSNKLEMYMSTFGFEAVSVITSRALQKFGMGRDQVLRMTAGMRQNFANVGLPYAFTDQGLVANTMDAHRVLAWFGSRRTKAVRSSVSCELTATMDAAATLSPWRSQILRNRSG